MDIIYEILDTVTDLKYLGSKRNYLGEGTYFGSLGCKNIKSKKYLLQQQWIENVKNRPTTFKLHIIEQYENINHIDLLNRELFYQKERNVVKSMNYVNAGYALKNGGVNGSVGGIGFKGKTYEEIYGDRAEFEKERRREKLKGKRSKEICENISAGLRGKSPWNKGLSKDDHRRRKFSEAVSKSLTGKFRIKYILFNILDDTKQEFLGFKSLTDYLKVLNTSLNDDSKIRIDILFKTHEFKNFKITKISI